MKKFLLTLMLALTICLPSLAQDLNFSAFNKSVAAKTTMLFEDEPIVYSYNDAVELAKKTGKVIVVTRDVDNEKEVMAQCHKNGELYVNGDGDTDFHVGLSKLEYLGGKILYIEMPPSAFPDKPQDVQYKINRDALRKPTVKSGKVLVPQKYAELNLDQPTTRWYNMDGTPYVPQQGVQMIPMQNFQGGNCASGVCSPGG